MKRSARFPYAFIMLGILFTLLVATLAPINTALAQSGMPADLGAPTPLSPNNAIKETKPTYRWTRVSGVISYQLQVLKEYNSTIVYSYTVTATSYCSFSTCSFTPGVKLGPFGYRWHVRVSGPSTTWSPLMKFYVRGESFSNHFTYNLMYWWTRKSGGTWYTIYNPYHKPNSLIGWLASNGLPDKCSAVVHYTSSTYDNFWAEAKIKITGSPSGGKYPEAYLTLRMKNGVDPASQCWYGGYLFGYSLDGKYSFWKMKNDGSWYALIPPTYSSAINKFSWNNFKVSANGHKFTLYINNVLVREVWDYSYDIGYVGFEMVNHGSGDTQFLADWITVDVIP